METFLLVFIPIFFAMDPIGILPIFASLTDELDKAQKSKIIYSSLMTASLVAIGFIFAGQAVMKLLGISMGDFMVAGGVILFCLGILEMIISQKPKLANQTDLGAVPIGTPLVVGPAVLTMSLMMVNQHGLLFTLLAVGANLMLVACVFILSDKLMGIIGKNGARALSKVLALLLAAIGVMMVRKGILFIVAGVHE